MFFYFLLKTIHILSSTILFGTGIGIAFFMWRANRSGTLEAKVYASRTTVLADFLFTTPAVIIQPLSGLGLVYLLGYDLWAPWLVISYCLYLIAGICWLPVVWIQLQLRNIAAQALKEQTPLPARYYFLAKIWFYLGWPAFISLVAIFWLMVNKPSFA